MDMQLNYKHWNYVVNIVLTVLFTISLDSSKYNDEGSEFLEYDHFPFCAGFVFGFDSLWYVDQWFDEN